MASLSSLSSLFLLASLGTAPAAELPVDDLPDAIGVNLEGVAYPFPSTDTEVTLDGRTLRLSSMDLVPDDAPDAPVIVLLHGKNFVGAYWEDVARGLLARGWRVLIPDHIGWGRSSKPDAFPWTFHALADATRQLLDAKGIDQAVIVGHSMGGMLATRFALSFPDRTAKLLMINPIGLEDWRQKTPWRPVSAWEARERNKTFDGVKAYMKASYFDGRWEPAWDRWVSLLVAPMQGPDGARLARINALHYDMVYTQPVVHEFGDLTVSTHLILGDRDRTALNKDLVSPEVAATLGDYPALGKAARKAIPGAKLTLLDNLGHIPWIEDWDRTWPALLDALADVAPGG